MSDMTIRQRLHTSQAPFMPNKVSLAQNWPLYIAIAAIVGAGLWFAGAMLHLDGILKVGKTVFDISGAAVAIGLIALTAWAGYKGYKYYKGIS